MLEITQKLTDLFRAYGAPVPAEKIILSAAAAKELVKLEDDIPDIDWADANAAEDLRHFIRAQIEMNYPDLRDDLNKARRAYEQNGVCILSFGDGFKGDVLDEVKTKLLSCLSIFGLPFGAFNGKGFWQTLGVNKNATNLRAESTGYIPLHIDFDQARNPPDGVALFCLRPDPRGGGESTVFDYQKFLSLLTEEDIRTLSEIEYSYSTLYNQNGIGDVFNPHPLLEQRGHKPSLLRYNAKALDDCDGNLLELFTQMEDAFKAASAVYAMKAGDMIVVDQNKTLHGRMPLGDGSQSDDVNQSEDRFLLQTYLRHE